MRLYELVRCACIYVAKIGCTLCKTTANHIHNIGVFVVGVVIAKRIKSFIRHVKSHAQQRHSTKQQRQSNTATTREPINIHWAHKNRPLRAFTFSVYQNDCICHIEFALLHCFNRRLHDLYAVQT